MKKIALIALLATTAFTPALAADLGRPVYKAPVAVEVPYTSWNGFYVGGSIGGAFGSNDRLDDSVLFGGGQIGYNWQFNRNWVFGIEADLMAVDAPFIDYLGTVRGRLGYAAGNVLFYGTGGLAYTRLSGFGVSTTATGFAVGGGIEWAFAPQWSVKAEYLYYRLERDGVEADFNTVKLGVNYRFGGAPIVASY